MVGVHSAKTETMEIAPEVRLVPDEGLPARPNRVEYSHDEKKGSDLPSQEEGVRPAEEGVRPAVTPFGMTIRLRVTDSDVYSL